MIEKYTFDIIIKIYDWSIMSTTYRPFYRGYVDDFDILYNDNNDYVTEIISTYETEICEFLLENQIKSPEILSISVLEWVNVDNEGESELINIERIEYE